MLYSMDVLSAGTIVRASFTLDTHGNVSSTELLHSDQWDIACLNSAR